MRVWTIDLCIANAPLKVFQPGNRASPSTIGYARVNKRRLWLLGVFFVCSTHIGLSGCGGEPELPPMAKVSGQVTVDGKPVPQAVVQFAPNRSKGTDGPPGIGRTDENGHYELWTVSEEGAVVGFHKVVVRDSRGWNPETNQGPAPLFPRRYTKTSESGLTAEVEADQENVFDWPLTSKP